MKAREIIFITLCMVFIFRGVKGECKPPCTGFQLRDFLLDELFSEKIDKLIGLCARILANENNYYEMLGVSKNAPPIVVSTAYDDAYKKIESYKKDHDNAKASEALELLKAAGSCLKDPMRRKNYDQRIESSSHNPKPESQQNENPNNAGPSFDGNKLDDLYGRIISNKRDYYEVVGVKKDAKLDDIKNSYEEAKTILVSYLKDFRNVEISEALTVLEIAAYYLQDSTEREKYDKRFKSSSSNKKSEQQANSNLNNEGPSVDKRGVTDLCTRIRSNEYDYYAVLGVEKGAKPEDIKNSYEEAKTMLLSFLRVHKSVQVSEALTVLEIAAYYLIRSRKFDQRFVWYPQNANPNNAGPSVDRRVADLCDRVLSKKNDYYEVVGVTVDAKPEDIKNSYEEADNMLSSVNQDVQVRKARFILEKAAKCLQNSEMRRKYNKSSTVYYYKLLGVGKDASEVDLKIAYRTYALQSRPDIYHAPEAVKAFDEVRAAYECLSYPSTRERYNNEGVDGCSK